MKLLDKLLTLTILVMGFVIGAAAALKSGDTYAVLLAWVGGMMFAIGLSESLRD